MPHNIAWSTRTSNHPGATAEEIDREPDWLSTHHIGVKNNQDRRAGITHAGDESFEEELAELQDKEREQEWTAGAEKLKHEQLPDWRTLIKDQPDLHLQSSEHRSLGWRYILDESETDIRENPEWPANTERQKKEREANDKQQNGGGVQNNAKSQNTDKDTSKDETAEEGGNADQGDADNRHEEHDWRRTQGERKHQDAYAAHNEDDDTDGKGADTERPKSEYQKLLERYTPQEIALLRSLQHEKDYMSSLQHDDGKHESPQKHNRSTVSILAQDAMTPDNWIPRSSELIRATGQHPLNAEAPLPEIFNAGLITPNELHYVRNHGAVPHLLWETHKLDVNGKLLLSMDDLHHKFEHINIPVNLVCVGQRRKELNMVKKTKGFDLAAGAIGCAYWGGPTLRSVLLAAGVPEPMSTGESKKQWVNFMGADLPSEGPYETSIPLDYCMDATNDVLLALQQNDLPLPPDHGGCLRLIVPGVIGGRSIKWLKRVWISDHENTSHYHQKENRFMPAFITESDGAFADAMFASPSTACYDQTLNSVICRPAHGEKIRLNDVTASHTYRIEGFAYDGGGREVQRVEVSLDDGKTWLHCVRKFTDAPIRHGNKFWAWIHFFLDVSTLHLLQSKSISVRAWDVSKRCQDRSPQWNLLGVLNNCWYVVKPEICQSKDDSSPSILFRHPVAQDGDDGWMKPSIENQLAAVKKEAGTPQKQFTRDEIEKHDTEKDCWIVIDGKVYDATSVLAWHPGGKAAILGHAGKVHQETTDEFSSIHDDFANQKLKECILGVVTEKAAKYIKSTAEATAKAKANAKNADGDIVLQKDRWVPVTLKERKELSEDTRSYIFNLPHGQKELGLGTCQHVQIGFHMKDKMLIRSYTPTNPLLPDGKREDDSSGRNKLQKFEDGNGTFELVVKTYFPTNKQPGGAMSNILDCVPVGEEVEIRGPVGEIEYKGDGKFVIDDEEKTFKKISLVLGGSGITPGYALIARSILESEGDVQIRVVDANKTEKDILLKDELNDYEQQSNGRLKITHVLSHPTDSWKGDKGHVDAEMIKKSLFPPEHGSVTFLCGPPGLIQKAALPALRDWGYKEDENMFGF